MNNALAACLRCRHLVSSRTVSNGRCYVHAIVVVSPIAGHTFACRTLRDIEPACNDSNVRPCDIGMLLERKRFPSRPCRCHVRKRTRTFFVQWERRVTLPPRPIFTVVYLVPLVNFFPRLISCRYTVDYGARISTRVNVLTRNKTKNNSSSIEN